MYGVSIKNVSLRNEILKPIAPSMKIAGNMRLSESILFIKFFIVFILNIIHEIFSKILFYKASSINSPILSIAINPPSLALKYVYLLFLYTTESQT